MSHDTTNNKKPASLPVTNPLQFVQIKPSKLYEKAKYQLKNDEEKKKVKTVVEDPEDWQSVGLFLIAFFTAAHLLCHNSISKWRRMFNILKRK